MTGAHAQLGEVAAALVARGLTLGTAESCTGGLIAHLITTAAGLMIGRGAIRNPWIFDQLRAAFDGRPVLRPGRRDLLEYVFELSEESAREARRHNPLKHVQKMKRVMVFIAQGIEDEFAFRMRRVERPEEFDGLCREFLDRDDPLPELPPERSKFFCGFGELVG